MTIYRQLPPQLQKDKAVLLLRMRVCQDNDQEYLAAMEDFRKYYPDDVALDFVLLDYYAIKKDHSALEACMLRLETNIGEDAYLRRLRAECVLEQGRDKEGRAMAEECIQLEPDFQMGHFALVTILARQEDHKSTLKQLKVIREKFALEFQDFSKLPDFGPFTKTEEFDEYQQLLLTPISTVATTGFDPGDSQWELPVPDPRPLIWIDEWKPGGGDSDARVQARRVATLADRYKAQGEFALAEETYQQAVKTDPTWPYPTYQRACNYVLAGQNQKALTAFQAAVKNGFANFTMAAEDDELGFIRELPEFTDHMKTIHQRAVARGNQDVGQPVAFMPKDKEAPEAGRPVILLLHGYGDTNKSYFEYARDWTRLGYIAVAVPGSVPFGENRFKWPDTTETTRENLQAILATESLASAIDEEKVFLLGFSQGAFHALIVGAEHPEEIAGVVALSPSGSLVSFLLNPEFKPATNGNRLLLVHGREEMHGRLTPRLAAACAKSGWKWQSSIHPGGHHFPGNWETMRRDVSRFLLAP